MSVKHDVHVHLLIERKRFGSIFGEVLNVEFECVMKFEIALLVYEVSRPIKVESDILHSIARLTVYRIENRTELFFRKALKLIQI